MRWCSLIGLLCVLAAPSARGQFQTLPVGFDQQAAGSLTSRPLRTFDDEVWHFVYDAGNFIAPTCININEIYFRVDANTQNAVSAWNFASFDVTLAYSANDYAQGSYDPVLANNVLGAQPVRTGPWQGGPVPATPSSQPGTWVPIGVQQPFAYDPSFGLDLIIEVRKCGTMAHWNEYLDVATNVAAMRYGDISNCQSTTWNYTQFGPGIHHAPVLGIDFTLNFGGCGASFGEYQTNQLGASFTVDGVQGPGPFAPIVSNRWSGEPSNVAVGAFQTQTGLPWNVALVQPGLTVPRSGGGITTAGGQIVNLDPAAISWAFGGANPLTGALFPGSTLLRVHAPVVTAQTSIAAQMFVVNPAASDGFSLSHAHELIVRPPPGAILVEALGPDDDNAETDRGFWRVTHFGGQVAAPRDPITAVALDWGTRPEYWTLAKPGLGDRFDGGSSVVGGCRGTYRKQCDQACGLIYAGTPVSGCDPTANTGWIPSGLFNLPPYGPVAKRIDFAFAPGTFTSRTFEFDADVIGAGTSVAGGGMAGLAVTITTDDGAGNVQTLTGTLAADPADPDRSYLVF